MAHKILCFGDSNTYGYDPRACLGGRYPDSVRWTALLEAAGWDVVCEGENGRSIPRLDWEMEGALRALRCSRAEAAVVMLGSNDLLCGAAAKTCGERMERFLHILTDGASPGLRLLLAAPPPMRPGAWAGDPRTAEESCLLAGCYRALAERLGVGFADAGQWNVELTFDGVHFSESGHRAFAAGAGQALSALFGEPL